MVVCEEKERNNVILELYVMDVDVVRSILRQTTYFHLHYNKSKKYNVVFDTLKEVVGCGVDKELWCLVTNTARALKQQAQYMQIPKDKDVYTGNQQSISFRKMSRMLDVLCEQGFLVFYKGGFINVKQQKYISSQYQITTKYKELWNGVDIDEELGYDGDLIEIKCRDTKDKLNAKIRGTAGIRALVESYNKSLCDVQLVLDNNPIPVQQYKRVFSGNLDLGGRFYNVVGGVQTMKQEDRKRLMINGENVVELDFKALHPSILYEKVWQEQPELVEGWIERAWDGVYNPYITKGSEVLFDLDNDEIAEHIQKYGLHKYNPIRNLFKFAVMASLNAKRGAKRPMLPAASALTQEWYDDKGKPQKDRKYVGLYPKGDKFPSLDLCELVVAANKPIAEHFCSDVGVKLQRIDSDIIEKVIQQLLEDGEVLYPEHDSVIVRESIEHRVTQLMRQAYFDVIGSDQFCVVEKK